MIKAVLALLFSSSLAFAQSQITPASAGCGPNNAKFEVKTQSHQHPAAAHDPAMASVYFIEDDSDFHSIPKPTDRVGVDGKWIGATHGNSHFSFPVEPGDHALCANWQSIVGLGGGKKAAAVQFTAQAGESYYFRMHEYFSTDRPVGVDLVPVDPAEGQLLVSSAAFSVFSPK